MKKNISIFLVIMAIACTFFGCSKSNNNNENTTANQVNQTDYFIASGVELSGLTIAGLQQKDITIPQDFESLGYCCFIENNNPDSENEILESVKFSNEYTTIGMASFRNCTSLKSITLPNEITEIPRAAFYQCKSLSSVIIPDNVTVIGKTTFWFCESLKEVKFNSKLKTIEEQAFQGCSSLKTIEFPEGLETIENEAFDSCYGLTKVYIPASVTSIGTLAFAQTINENGETNKITIYVKEGSYADKFFESYNDGSLVKEYY